jgi:serine/threonine-protein kinase RsbW
MSKNIDELPEGGMGIKVMSKVADELSYTRTSGETNCLSMVKNYEQQSLDQSHWLQKGNPLEWLIDLFNHLNWFKDKHSRQQLCDTPLQKFHLQVNTDIQAVEQVLDWFEPLKNLPIPQEVFWQCQLALIEGFTNVVRHAHQSLPLETPIELEVTVFNGSLDIRIWDYGQPFDLEAKLRELKEIDQEGVLSEGGRGIEIMFKLADRVSYTRTSDERNCLVMVKRLSPSLTV